MINYEVINSIKRRINELNNEELIIIKDYCNFKIESVNHRTLQNDNDNNKTLRRVAATGSMIRAIIEGSKNL